MSTIYVMVPEVLSKFKEPFGILLRGSFSKSAQQLRDLVEKEKPPMIVSVGDTVSRNLHKHKLAPHLAITDNLNLRKKVQPQTFPGKRVVHVKNPMGTITQEAVLAIKEALRGPEPIQILVDGEEDLLTLIAVLYAPKNAFVVYGQPRVGMVLVKVDDEKRAEAQLIWKKMHKIEETNPAKQR
jgi:GTP-dependent dephospho-CoA kinase